MGAKCPVCGAPLAGETEYKTLYKGQVYHFCCSECKEEFEASPEKYV